MTPEKSKAPRVFISYRHVKPDEDLALAIEQKLTGEGCKVFVDRRMLIGTEWATEIDRQLNAADFFVVLLSSESIRSDMVRQEIKLAHELKQQAKLRILPIRVDFTGALPYDLGGYLNPLQYVVWQQGQSFHEITETLHLAIRNARELPHVGRTGGDSLAEIQELHDVTEKRGAPLPQIDPRVLELALERGAMACHSPFYVRRTADDEMERLLNRRGTTTIVKGARQMGKSSLLVRSDAYAKNKGCLVCYIDFQRLDEAQLKDLNSLLRYLMHRLARDLKTTRKPEDYWNEYLGAKDSATDFMEDAVLADPNKQVVLMLDEADRVFKYDYRNDFFALLRFWTNRRADSQIWERCNLVVANATDPVLWIDDINQSPFNIGYAILLEDFDDLQFNDLAQRYGLSLADAELESIRALIGGHPFLVRQALYLLASGMTWRDLETRAIRQDGPFGDHLKRLSGLLLTREALRRAILQILRGSTCDDEHSFQRLFTAGLVVGASRHEVRLRCRLYELYFGINL
ncbi:hypothetical protein CRENPOLYSF2_3630002 [Crenothrix polyspora]|uniref:TIR domain-containing protein n=1 Tax=Crenothrix polyspora TaxID=360316 RepID=A0A1R4HCQ4_9GAMM|nr:AAA-like domain-containing protein [Crenothrix polyspora]SJM93811.1 hypothetical protein CRENPOLYSF2_3630002 [Crenothrix polyspora]